MLGGNNKDNNSKNHKEEFTFITEKIKEKPINKKKIAIKIISTVLLAIIFGVVACFTFVGIKPLAEKLFVKEENPVITIPRDEEADLTEKPEEETPPAGEENNESPESGQTEEQPETPPQGTEEEIEIPPVELEVEDLKSVYDKLYRVAEESKKSMVMVTAVTNNEDWFNNTYEKKGQVSGVIIGNNGRELLILTEREVLSGADQIKVSFSNEDTYVAEIKKYDGNTGLAILSVSLSQIKEETFGKFKEAALGNSFSVTQGNIVIALGSPLGYTNSMTYGIITSDKNMAATMDVNYNILTTDIIGSPNGSGVLLNIKGEVIGVITQKYSTDSGHMMVTGVGISDLKTIIEKLSNGQSIPYMGVKGAVITSSIAEEMDMPVGIYVTEVAMDSPAMNAGIQNGDIIIKFNRNQVSTMRDYQNELWKLQPGQIIEVGVMRLGAEGYKGISFNATIGEMK